jgi:hypothetical protein
MANEKVSQLPVVASSSGSDLYMVVQSGVSSSISFTNLQSSILSGFSGGVSSLNGLEGALNLIAGSGITITPSGTNITISATVTGAANQYLSNLLSPTAINQDLLWGSNGVNFIGDAAGTGRPRSVFAGQSTLMTAFPLTGFFAENGFSTFGDNNSVAVFQGSTNLTISSGGNNYNFKAFNGFVTSLGGMYNLASSVGFWMTPGSFDAQWIVINSSAYPSGPTQVLYKFTMGGDGSFQLNDEANANILANQVSATPTAPASGMNRLYFKSDNNLYMLNSSSVETQISGLAAGANVTLSNLTAPTAINQDLSPSVAGGNSLGNVTYPWENIYLNTNLYFLPSQWTIDGTTPGGGFGNLSFKGNGTEYFRIEGNSETVMLFPSDVTGIGIGIGSWPAITFLNSPGHTGIGWVNTDGISPGGGPSLFFQPNGSSTLMTINSGGVNSFGNFNLPLTTASVGQITQGGFAIFHTANANNIFIGNSSGMAGNFSVTGAANVGIGKDSLLSLTSGDYFIAIGNRALQTATNQTVGTIAFGQQAFQNANPSATDVYGVVGDAGIAIGIDALVTATTAIGNVGIGAYALAGANSNYNTAVGSYAGGDVVAGANNSCFGFTAFDSPGTTDGSNNSIFGAFAFSQINGTVNNNSVFGYNAGALQSLYTQCVLIGSDADTSANNLTNAIAIGYGASVNISNFAQIGNSSLVGMGWSGYADMTQIATPANPAPGHDRLYFKSDDNLYILNSADTETKIQTALSFGNLTDSTSGADGITVTGGTGVVIGSGTSIAQTQAGASTNGYLSSTDWNTFNNKQTPLSFIDSLTDSGGNVSLVNDSVSPGDSYYYGTNGSGTKGYFSLPTAIYTAPTTQVFLSGSGTYTTPASVLYIRVRMVGGGAGGNANGGAGSAGGNTTFGTSLLNSGGGQVNSTSPYYYGGAGGTFSLGGLTQGFGVVGGCGSNGESPDNATSGLHPNGGIGGVSALGGAGVGATVFGPMDATAGATNTGAGGGGGAISAGGLGAGGAGAYIDMIIPAPSATYPYVVGAGGAAGTNSGGEPAADGASGMIIVDEYYQ